MSIVKSDGSLWCREINSLYNELRNFVAYSKTDRLISMIDDNSLDFASVISVNHTSK